MPIYIGKKPLGPYTFPNNSFNLGISSGSEGVPWDIRKRRLYALESLKRMGTVVMHKHRYTDIDVREGLAKKADSRDPVYGQARNTDILTLGTGYVSVEDSNNEWVNKKGEIKEASSSPGNEWQKAPKYRGFGAGSIIYVIFPDAARNYFSYDPGGAIYNIEESFAVAGWNPKIYDGDLLITVLTDSVGNVIEKGEIYEAKQVRPITIRGRDRLGRPEIGDQYPRANTQNRFMVNQKFSVIRLPNNDYRNEIPVDR